MVAWILRSELVAWRPTPRQWIVGVFESLERAQEHLAALPGAIRANCTLGQRDDLSFPCFLAEDHREIRILAEHEVRAELFEAAKNRKSDDFCYTNLYRLTEEFTPGKPGRDDMGRICHWHIENEHLDKIVTGGLESLWAEHDDREGEPDGA